MFRFDGWYSSKTSARDVLKCLIEEGAYGLGLVESDQGTWGILYWSEKVLMENHVLNDDNALMWELRRLVHERKGVAA